MESGNVPDSVAKVREKPDLWHDFRRGIALLMIVLFWLCLVATGFLLYKLVTVGTEVFDLASFLTFSSVAVPLGVAAFVGFGVYRAKDNTQAKRRGRIMGLFLAIAIAVYLINVVIEGLLA